MSTPTVIWARRHPVAARKVPVVSATRVSTNVRGAAGLNAKPWEPPVPDPPGFMDFSSHVMGRGPFTGCPVRLDAVTNVLRRGDGVRAEEPSSLDRSLPRRVLPRTVLCSEDPKEGMRGVFGLWTLGRLRLSLPLQIAISIPTEMIPEVLQSPQDGHTGKSQGKGEASVRTCRGWQGAHRCRCRRGRGGRGGRRRGPRWSA